MYVNKNNVKLIKSISKDKVIVQCPLCGNFNTT